MAAVSLSPNPIPLSAMTSRSSRVPLSTNYNAANSPLRGASAAAKQKRSFAYTQREEAYGQQPPAKRQMLDSASQRVNRSPSKPTKAPLLAQRRNASSYESKLAKERGASQQQADNASTKYSEKELEEIRQWQKHHRARFPKMVFYFEHVPNDIRAKLTKQVMSLGAREEKFFSIEITHVITTRPIPPEKSASQPQEHEEPVESHEGHEQLQTINPSLLNRMEGVGVKRRLFDTIPSRKTPINLGDSALRRPQQQRNMDVLHRAREMNKKIWSLDKLQRMLSMLLEPDPYSIAYGSRTGTSQAAVGSARAVEESNLLQLLHNERVNGPSDRDHTVATRELHHFKGPYIYIYDIEEKQKPIMVREYAKVAEKHEGDWPQFRSVANGRCPFVEDHDAPIRIKEDVSKAPKPSVEPKVALKAPQVTASKPLTRKRTVSQMEDGVRSRESSVSSVRPTEVFAKPTSSRSNSIDLRAGQNAFISQKGTGRLFGGEPVASGLQASNVTSAIRSQMISSTAAVPGAKAGLSKEVHGLQRQVLQRNSTATSQDFSQGSRRPLGDSLDLGTDSSMKRPTLGRTSSKRLENLAEDEAAAVADSGEQKPRVKVATKPRKKDPKPGYCENCQDKFDDFDDHILTRKHRRFADNDANWVELDDLLTQLERLPKHQKRTAYWAESGYDDYVEV